MIIKTIILSLGFVLAFTQVLSQNIDSLQALLQTKTGGERADILRELSYAHIDTDNTLAYRYGLEGFRIAQEDNDSLRIVGCGRFLASSLRRLGRIDSSLVIYNTILPIAEYQQDRRL